MSEVSPTVPQDYATLKDALRGGLPSREARAYWWPLLPTLPLGVTIERYPDLRGAAEKLSAQLGEPLLLHRELSQEDTSGAQLPAFVASAAVKLQHLLNKRGMLVEEEGAGCETLLRLLASQMLRLDVSYLLACDLLSNRERFLDPSPSAQASLQARFCDTLSAFSPKTYAALFGIGALEGHYLQLMLRDFFVELLPADVVLRLLDAFLLEGVKILFRYGLALVRGYKSQIKSGDFSTAAHFWLSVKADAVKHSHEWAERVPMLYRQLGLEERLPVADPFVLFSKAKNPSFLQGRAVVEFPFDEDRSVFSKMLRPMGVTTASAGTGAVSRRGSSTAGVVGVGTGTGVGAGGAAGTGDSTSGAANSTSASSSSGGEHSPVRTSSVAHLIASTEVGVVGSPPGSSGAGGVSMLARRGSSIGAGSRGPRGSIDGGDSVVFRAAAAAASAAAEEEAREEAEFDAASDIAAMAQQLSLQSRILDVPRARQLLTHLGDVHLLWGFELCFSSHKDGYSLSSLYAQGADRHTCLLVAQLAAPFEAVTVGAFLAQPLSPPSKFTRGDQHSAVFCLGAPGDPDSVDCRFFPWVGLEGGGEKELEGALMQFCVARLGYLSFGASEEGGSTALRLDEDLHTLYTGPSDTYGNPPLPPADMISAGGGSFAIRDIELLCGRSATR